MAGRIDFDAINRAALERLPDLLSRWLPDGRIEGLEFVAKNPRRAVISLAAYLDNTKPIEAARNLAHMLGLAVDD